MALNHPYDPRHNAKIYIPKLTEEERRAHATPLENLRGLRFRTESPATPSPAEEVVPAPVTAPIAPDAPSPAEDVVPALVPTQIAPVAPCLIEAAHPAPTPAQDAPVSEYIPTAREILFAEFPEFFPFPYQEVNEEAHLQEKCVTSEPCLVGGGPEGTVLHARARAPQDCFPLHKTPTPDPGTPQRAGPSPDLKNAGRSRTPGGLRRVGIPSSDSRPARCLRNLAFRTVPLQGSRTLLLPSPHH